MQIFPQVAVAAEPGTPLGQSQVKVPWDPQCPHLQGRDSVELLKMPPPGSHTGPGSCFRHSLATCWGL